MRYLCGKLYTLISHAGFCVELNAKLPLRHFGSERTASSRPRRRWKTFTSANRGWTTEGGSKNSSEPDLRGGSFLPRRDTIVNNAGKHPPENAPSERQVHFYSISVFVPHSNHPFCIKFDYFQLRSCALGSYRTKLAERVHWKAIKVCTEFSCWMHVI